MKTIKPSTFSQAFTQSLIIALSTAAITAHANQTASDDEVLVITKQVAASQKPVAIMPFAGDAALSGTISSLLDGAGLGANSQNLPMLTQSSAQITSSLTQWRNAGYQHVVLGQVHSITGNKVAINYQIINTQTGTVSSQQTQISDNTPTAKRAAAHKVSDQIFQAITGNASDLTGVIAYVEESGSPTNKTSSLKIMDVSGQTIRTLDTVSGSIMTPVFSKDGTQIAYSTQADQGLPVIRVISVSGGQPQLVTPFWGHNLAPSFSPDGTSLLFSGSHENNNPNIYRLHLNTNRLERITNLSGAENSPNYLPDGSGFIYTADHGTRSQSLQRYDFNSGRSQQIAARASNPRLSLDGSKLVYVASGRIVIASPQGRVQQSFAVPGTEVSASFSPSGNSIVYAASQGNQSRLVVRSLTSNASRTILSSGTVRDPIWSN